MFRINNLFLFAFLSLSLFCIGSCCRSIFCCQGSECNFQLVIGQQAKHIAVGRPMKLFYTQGFHITPLCTNKETIILFTKATMSSFRTVFSQSSTGVLNLFLSEDALCVSQSDKALVLVDISHCISTSQLEELVHSVICQQVLRLCQKQ